MKVVGFPRFARAGLAAAACALLSCAEPRPGALADPDAATDIGVPGGKPSSDDAGLQTDAPPSDAATPDAPIGRPACVAQAEICDGRDNDCDGKIDEELIQSCDSACGGGSRICVTGKWDSSACPRQPAPDDAMACGAMGAASCVRCPQVGNGAAICTDGICGVRCDGEFTHCSGVPGACVQASWGFESGGTEGFGLAGYPSEAAEGIGVGTVRAAEGSRALTVPARFGGPGCEKNEVRVQLNHCPAGGGSDFSGKTLTF